MNALEQLKKMTSNDESNDEDSDKKDDKVEKKTDSNKKDKFDVSDKHIKWFSDLDNSMVSVAGGKGASLSEMYNHSFPVPPGFVISAQSFGYFIEEGGLKQKITDIIDSVDNEDTKALRQASDDIRKLIEESQMPEDLREEIVDAYKILSDEKVETKGISQDALNILRLGHEPTFVSVRSSATTEDLVEASFAGQQDSFLNVKGEKKLIEFVKKCFSSLYTARAIYYRKKQGFTEGEALLAVVIQKMVDSEKSGVMFSRNPITLGEEIIIEAVYGLGEGIVAGKIFPDHYVVTRNLEVESIKVGEKKIAIVRTSAGTNDTVKLNQERSMSQVLTQGEILECANYAMKLEDHYKKPQDIEFAIEDNKVYIVQSRPITTLNPKKEGDDEELTGNVLIEGLSASPGIGVGHVKIVNDMDDLSKIKTGDVLVTKMTNPDMVVSMEKSVAIVTDEGGMTSHASIVSREMGIPCIVGCGTATEKLKEGSVITVDGNNGKVYEGEVAKTSKSEILPAVPTKNIHLKVIVDLPKFTNRAAKTGISDIGLTRVEGMIASMGKHPEQYEREDKLEDYTKVLQDGIEEIIKPFRLMWIRSSDIRTDEYGSLEGAPEREINPMMGLHGIRFSLKHPKIFEAELEAIKRVAEKNPEKKLGVMFPQITSLEEVQKTKEIFNKYKTDNMQFGVMIETPGAVQIIEEICQENIDFISFGTNDLTQFTLGVDRGEDTVQFMYDELHPGVLRQIAYVIKVCKKHGVESSICGQAGSNPEMVKHLIRFGIDSISLNADAANEISKLIQELEPNNYGIELNEGETKQVTSSTEQIKPEETTQNSNIDSNKDSRIINCDNCGKETKLPFKPKPGKPAYCKKCFKKIRKSNQNQSKLPNMQNQTITMNDIDKKQEELVKTENVVPEVHQTSEIKEANEIAKNTSENEGTIQPFDNLEHIKEEGKELAKEQKKINDNAVYEDKKQEDKIETEIETTSEEFPELA